MMNCKQATQLLSEKMDRTLTTKEKLALKMHITLCSACRQFGNQMIDLRTISKSYVKNQNQNKK
jgi:predicted anti-sigma-YlaC factor YlaD